jgi:OTU domain-containing protein 6
MEETLEQLQARHSKERKDLQARTTAKKKSASKKNRKGVNTECDELEISLRIKQEQELMVLNGVPDVDDVPDLEEEPESTGKDSAVSEHVNSNSLADDLNKTAINGDDGSDGESAVGGGSGGGKKRNRQKERLARRVAEQEAAALEAEKEAAKLPNWKRQERSGMLKAFKENGLVEEEIRPDGHCLFSAVADQLKQEGIELGGEPKMEEYKIIRKTAGDYIEAHGDEFSGFLEKPLLIYVHTMRDTAEWGGQLELIALAKSYGVEICVLQNGRIDRFEPENGKTEDTKTIWLAYYRHGYGLGEHYNSLRKAP